MAFVSAVTGEDSTKKFIDVLQNDFKNLSTETRKKYPQIREACDEAVEKLSNSGASLQNNVALYAVVNQILYPLVQGCESKDLKIIKFCLGTIQRLIAQQCIDAKGARHIVDCLTALGQGGHLELKLLQTAALLMTTSDLVHGDTLAKTLVLCMRMVWPSESRDLGTTHAAAATVRQLVALVFERASAETRGEVSEALQESKHCQTNVKYPKELQPMPCAADAYLIFEDIVRLINGDQPHWLVGLTEIPKTFGLELLDTILNDFSEIFFQINEFRFLLKEHVCALIIRLFSPNVKYRTAFISPNIPGANNQNSQTNSSSPNATNDRPHFPVSMRLLRLVSVIIHKYHFILVTECEIFLSLTIKFLDPDKPLWQRALALEVLHKISIKPELLMSFCECYDLKPHATNIFQDIVNALGAYVQSQFVASQVNVPGGIASVPQQSGFYWKGVWLPLCVTFEPGTAKSTYLEMLERTDSVTIQEGYGISIAYACLMEIIRSLALKIEGDFYFTIEADDDETDSKTEPITKDKVNEIKSDHNSNNESMVTLEEKDKAILLQLIKSSWCGLVWGLSVLAEASLGELENILRGLQTLLRISGKIGEQSGRDACVSALCRAALPAHYWVPALGPPPRAPNAAAAAACVDTDARHQVVAVGAPLPSATTPAGQQQSFVMVTARHIAAMRRLLVTARRDGAWVGRAWPPLLTTLQHLVWILGLKPATGGSMKASRNNADSNAVMSTSAVMADLPKLSPVAHLIVEHKPMLSSMLSRVFESSKNLDDDALLHLIDALCKLSNEAMELAYSNREPSLFAVAKLLETGLANLHRVEVIWRPITSHLLEVCQHPHIRMREWGVEAITYLVQDALQYHQDHPELNTESRIRLVVEPLSELSSAGARYGDVRARQLHACARLLHTRGDRLAAAWPLLINVISAISSRHSPQLIGSAFQCVQLVAADLLPSAGPRCLKRFLAAVAAFAQQTHDLNISLTAVGLMWNISDYLYHNHDKLTVALADEAAVFPELPQHSHLSQFDKLWMCLYLRLGELCCESRAPVRRAAGQTLFSCIHAHSALLPTPAFHTLLHHVLFPMLYDVQKHADSASNETMHNGEQILIHHSRNTAHKQWAETQVLTLSGVSRVFHSKFQLLSTIPDFVKSWTALLDIITDFALMKNEEVAVASLKSFQEVLSAANKAEGSVQKQVWAAAWAAWTKIANGATAEPKRIVEPSGDVDEYKPSPQFLVTIVQIFPIIFHNIRTSVSGSDILVVGRCLCGAVKICDLTPQSTLSPSPPLAPLAAHCMDLVQKEALVRHELLQPTYKALLALAEVGSARTSALTAVVSTYRSAPQHLPQAACTIVKALHEAVLSCQNIHKLKTSEAKSDNGKDSTPSSEANLISSLLLQVLAAALPLATNQPEVYKDFWEQLPNILETFLFQAPVSGANQLVELIKSELIRASPSAVAHKLLNMLQKGLNRTQERPFESDLDSKEREEFARNCLETLLQFSMVEKIQGVHDFLDGDDGAMTSNLFDIFTKDIQKYSSTNSDEKLDRNKQSELSFALKGISILADYMKRAPSGRVETSTWQKLIASYPHLISCAGENYGKEVSAALKEALLHFNELIKPPYT